MRERADTIRDEPREEMDDLELLTRMLNGQLDAARVAIVRKRLEDDPAFRDFAAPLLLTWSVPPHRERFPLPEGAWEHAWERLQQRIRIEIPSTPPAPAPKRSRIGRIFEIGFWLAMIYVVVLSLGTIIWDDLIQPNFFPKPTDGFVAPAVPAQPTP